jgi:hypothetical protein
MAPPQGNGGANACRTEIVSQSCRYGSNFHFEKTWEAAMPSLEDVVAKHKAGHTFWLSPHLLGMAPEIFDSFARQVWAAGGGDGFATLDFKKESQSGEGLYALLQCKRV